MQCSSEKKCHTAFSYENTLYFQDIVAEKPKYEIGSASKLSFSRKDLVSERITKVWKLSDNDGDLINENDLLDESDKAKPNPTDLKGTFI